MKSKEILKAFEFRNATKSFDSTKRVSDEDFLTILEAGRLSPSSYGFEPWKFMVLQNAEILEKLRDVAWGARNSIDGASHFVILLARKAIDTKFDSEYVRHMLRDIQQKDAESVERILASYQRFQEKDLNLLESDRTLFDWASKQTYIALANMMTTAALLQIDSCPIEGFDLAGVEKLLVDEGVLDSTHFGVSVMVSFGYRAAEPAHAKTRQSFDDVVIWQN